MKSLLVLAVSLWAFPASAAFNSFQTNGSPSSGSSSNCAVYGIGPDGCTSGQTEPISGLIATGPPLTNNPYTIQHSNFFSGFARQQGQTWATTGGCAGLTNCHPPWNVAGVDYPVGVRDAYASALKDPTLLANWVGPIYASGTVAAAGNPGDSVIRLTVACSTLNLQNDWPIYNITKGQYLGMTTGGGTSPGCFNTSGIDYIYTSTGPQYHIDIGDQVLISACAICAKNETTNNVGSYQCPGVQALICPAMPKTGTQTIQGYNFSATTKGCLTVNISGGRDGTWGGGIINFTDNYIKNSDENCRPGTAVSPPGNGGNNSITMVQISANYSTVNVNYNFIDMNGIAAIQSVTENWNRGIYAQAIANGSVNFMYNAGTLTACDFLWGQGRNSASVNALYNYGDGENYELMSVSGLNDRCHSHMIFSSIEAGSSFTLASTTLNYNTLLNTNQGGGGTSELYVAQSNPTDQFNNTTVNNNVIVINSTNGPPAGNSIPLQMAHASYIGFVHLNNNFMDPTRIRGNDCLGQALTNSGVPNGTSVLPTGTGNVNMLTGALIQTWVSNGAGYSATPVCP